MAGVPFLLVQAGTWKTWKNICLCFYVSNGSDQEEEEHIILWFCALILSGKDMAMTIHSSTDCGCFHTSQLSWIIVTENIWPTSQKYDLYYHIMEKACRPLIWINHPGSTGKPLPPYLSRSPKWQKVNLSLYFNATVAIPHCGSISLLGIKFFNQQSPEFWE